MIMPDATARASNASWVAPGISNFGPLLLKLSPVPGSLEIFHKMRSRTELTLDLPDTSFATLSSNLRGLTREEAPFVPVWLSSLNSITEEQLNEARPVHGGDRMPLFDIVVLIATHHVYHTEAWEEGAEVEA
jgi:hypothetical protein